MPILNYLQIGTKNLVGKRGKIAAQVLTGIETCNIVFRLC